MNGFNGSTPDIEEVKDESASGKCGFGLDRTTKQVPFTALAEHKLISVY
jgi:hypothetical protein